MLGSNQRPLPCEDRYITSCLFAGVPKYLQNGVVDSSNICGCSQLFVWIGVLLVYTNTAPTLSTSYTIMKPLPAVKQTRRRNRGLQRISV